MISPTAKKKTIALFFLWCSISLLLPGDTGKHDPAKAVSILRFIPGIEQIKQKRYLKGGLLAGAFATTIVGAVVANSRGYDYYDRYLASTDVDEIIDLRQRSERCFKTRNALIVGIFAVVVIHLVDIKFFSKKRGGLKGEIKNNSIHLGVYYNF